MSEDNLEEKREKALAEVKMYQSNDWDLIEETPEYFMLKRNKQSFFIHLILAIFFWWTFGLVNLAYWYMKNEKKKIIK